MLQGIKKELSALIEKANSYGFDGSATLLQQASDLLDRHFRTLGYQQQKAIESFFEEQLSSLNNFIAHKVSFANIEESRQYLAQMAREMLGELQQRIGRKIPVAKAPVDAPQAPAPEPTKRDPFSTVLESITDLFKMTSGGDGATNFRQLGRGLPRAMIGILTGILSMLLPESIMNKITKFTAPLLDMFDKNVATAAKMTADRRSAAMKKAPSRKSNSDSAHSSKARTFTPDFKRSRSRSFDDNSLTADYSPGSERKNKFK